MRSISVKLTLAFLLVGLVGALLVATLVQFSTRREFGRLILDQNQQALITNLTRYYQATGSWNGVEAVFHPERSIVGQRDQETRWDARRLLFMLADQNGKVVYGGSARFLGRVLAASELRQGVVLEVNGRQVGWLIFSPTLDRWEPGTAEADFLSGVSRGILLSAVIAVMIALLLGSILAYSLTRTLRELTTATRLLGSGQLGHQVEVRSKDELGELAAAFNQMSAELSRSTNLRRKMTADIAHDLRTPLSVILGYTEALSDGKLQPDAGMFDVLHTEALHLSHLVDDLKTLSLAEAGELPLNRQPISPEILIRRAASSHRVQADTKGIQISVQVESALPEIDVDVERMAQVLGNLMSNALRYTPAGGSITLGARSDGRMVQISVADTGPGIAADHLPYIFERSFRGDKARQQQNGESGLGLAIAKSLVEAQGGKISVESILGKGTVMTVRLPITNLSGQVSAASPPAII